MAEKRSSFGGWNWDSVNDMFKDVWGPDYGRSTNEPDQKTINIIRELQLANFELAKQFFVNGIFVEVSRDTVANIYVETHLDSVSKRVEALNIKTTFDSLYENNISKFETALKTAFDVAITSVATISPEDTVTFNGRQKFIYATADRNAIIAKVAVNVATGKSVVQDWPIANIRQVLV